MYKRIFLCFFALITSIVILFSGCSNNSPNHKNPGRKWNLGSDTGNELSRFADHKVTVQRRTFTEPARSGPVTAVPWENDPRFKKAQTQNGCPVLMAAFCTVLRDPLPGEENNVHLGARLLAGTLVKPGEVFSQNLAIGPYTESRGFGIGPTYIGSQLHKTVGGGVCKIASTLYNVTVLSNLQVVERHAHSMPVPYVPYGQDATVAYGVRDFKFRNNTSDPVLIWAQGVDNRLYIAFYGRSKPPRVTWHHHMLKKIKTQTVYRTNPELPVGVKRILLEGMDGALVKSWVTIAHRNGTTETRLMGYSYYSPMAHVIEQGRAPTSANTSHISP